MVRNLDQLIAIQDELADYFESLGEDGAEDPVLSARARLVLAAGKRSEVEAELLDRVVAARGAGMTWKDIGQVLGTSGEAARQRYGNRVAS
ncbi:hypothetical protein [Nocardioides sp. Kera G14]|uniref:hypothetical protein n=1 Tax=Nocardioides sp. Kera G14 TaxID=2884264 RepID=UPI001D0FAB5E|nr:hypothetical protein [Nocardioides sp. Kera G14]UDY24220.1 hypothetical protein LH076_02675 [Nocardioides sp. Kera G14]